MAKWCRLPRAQFRKAWAKVSASFVLRDGRYYHPRLDKERAKQAEWSEKSRKGGIASGQHRAKGGSRVVEPTTQPNGNTLFVSPSPITTPTTAAHVDKWTGDEQAAYHGYLRAHANPDAFDRTLTKLADPPSGNGFGWTVLGQALASMAGNGASFNEALARGYCRNIVTPPPVRQAPPPRGGWQKPDPSPVNVHSAAPAPKSTLCPFCNATSGIGPKGRIEVQHEEGCHAA
jgi:hypothetical protein